MSESTGVKGPPIPPEIGDSLHRFQEVHAGKGTIGFLMMRFATTKAHKAIERAVKSACKTHGLLLLRADDREFHTDLYWNIVTYCHGCAFGIAVFERVETDTFNPNVSYEIGYMNALRKPVCLLKDRTLTTLHADLIGKLYRVFDPQAPAKTVPPIIEKWLADAGLAVSPRAEKPVVPIAHRLYPYPKVADINLTDTRILQRLIQGKTPGEIRDELGVPYQVIYSVRKRHSDALR